MQIEKDPWQVHGLHLPRVFEGLTLCSGDFKRPERCRAYGVLALRMVVAIRTMMEMTSITSTR